MQDIGRVLCSINLRTNGADSKECRFTESVIKAVKGQKGIVEPSYVYLPGISGGEAIAKETGVDFFSVPIEFGSSGAEKAHNVLTSVSPEEKELLEAAKTGLKGSIEKGVAFVAKSPEQK
ncbi:hypothetical protein Q9189_002053 [Teloschistes chrysophthalmus]